MAISKHGDKSLIDPVDMEGIARVYKSKANLNYEARFLHPRSCISAYLCNLMDLTHLKKNFDIVALFDAEHMEAKQSSGMEPDEESYMYFVDNEDNHLTYRDHGDMIMRILREVEPDSCFSLGFWNYYMNGILTKEQVEECCDNGYMNTYEVISAYLDRHKILSEVQLEEKSENEEIDPASMFIFDDEEKLLQFFTPDIIASAIANGEDGEVLKIFINKYLKKMYEEHNRNLLQEVYDDVLDYFDNEDDPCFVKSTLLISMYESGYIGIEQLNDDRISKQDIEEILDKGLQCKPLVADMYNNDLVDGETILEKYSEDDIFDLISEGMNPSVIQGFYSTRELVSIVVGNKINGLHDLSCLRSDIDIDEIKKMYQPSFDSVEADKSGKKMDSGLSYDDLARLVVYGLITAEEADMIDQDYDYKLKLDQLMDEGLIVGDKNGIRVARNEGDRRFPNTSSYGCGRIDDRDKQRLYLALDDEYVEFELGSDVLKHYKLVIMPKNKIAIMEPDEDGQGASYVMSIKLALDQISNNGSEESEKVDPLKAYQNRTGIRSIPGMETVNHRENWGYNLQKKMKAIHKNMDQLIYSKDGNDDERVKHKLKIESIQEDIKSKYIRAREKTKLLESDNLETEDID